MNKVEDLSRQVCQQVIVKTEGTKRMQPTMNAVQKLMAVSKLTTMKAKQRTWFPKQLRPTEVKQKGAETKPEYRLVNIMRWHLPIGSYRM